MRNRRPDGSPAGRTLRPASLSRRRGAGRSGRRRRSARSGVPSSTMRPSWTTRTRSAVSTVESRCAMISAVRPAPGHPPVPASRTFHAGARPGRAGPGARDGMSSEDVASSRISTAGPGQERPGEADQLALPGGDAAAALVDVGVVAVGEFHDEGVGAHGPGRVLDLLARGLGPAQGDVVRHGAAEQEGLLGDHDDRSGAGPRCELAQVHAVEGQRTRRRRRRSGRSASRAWICRRRSARRARPSARRGCAGPAAG